MAPGLLFASAISSWTLCAASDGCTASTSAMSLTIATGAKSRTGSYGMRATTGSMTISEAEPRSSV